MIIHKKLKQHTIIIIVEIILLLAFSSVFSYAASKDQHDPDIAYVVFGVDSVKDISEEYTTAFAIVTDAIAFAIDENGYHSDTSYNSFVEMVKQKNVSIGNSLPPYNDETFPGIGLAPHRAYCHQGFYYDYTNDNVAYKERWQKARDYILIPSVAAAFELDINDAEDYIKAVIISIAAYYTHIIGDINDGELKYMKNLNTYQKALDQFIEDINLAKAESTDPLIKNYCVQKVSSLNDFYGARGYMNESIYPLVAQMTGMPYSNSIFDKITKWFSNLFR